MIYKSIYYYPLLLYLLVINYCMLWSNPKDRIIIEKIEDIIFGGSYNAKKQCLKLSYQFQYWERVLQYQKWNQLRQLNLASCSINDTDVTTIAQLPWPHLIQLKLSHNQITVVGIELLLKSVWPCLTSLFLQQNSLKICGMLVIFSSQSLPSLKFLYLENNGIQIWKQNQLIQLSSNISKIKSLSLSDNAIGSSGTKFLAKIDLNSLQALQLDNCQLGDQGVKHLSKLNCSSMKQLNIRKNNIGYKGVEQLQNFKISEIMLISIKDIQKINLNSLFCTNLAKNALIGCQWQNFIIDVNLQMRFQIYHQF